MNNNRYWSACVFACVISAGALDSATAQTGFEEPVGRATSVGSGANGINILGDQFDPNTGRLSFAHTDVSIPGNSGLSVGISRTRLPAAQRYNDSNSVMGDWTLDLPRVTAMISEASAAPDWCSSGYRPSDVTIDRTVNEVTVQTGAGGFPIPLPRSRTFSQRWEYEAFWQGFKLTVPGRVNEQILDGGGRRSGTEKGTVSNWSLDCLPNNTGLIAYAPNGDRFTFNKYAIRNTSSIWTTVNRYSYNYRYNNIEGKLESRTEYHKLGRRYAMLLPTEVRDADGNWVKYSYSGSKLTKIEANDGRVITVQPRSSSNNTTKVIANGRTWSYNFGGDEVLDSVVLPDGRKWTFSNLTRMDQRVYTTGDQCRIPGDQSFSVWHPDGMRGDFKTKLTVHGRTNVPWREMERVPSGSCAPERAEIQRYSRLMSLKEKTLSGPGVPATKWTYTYDQSAGAHKGRGSGQVDTKWVEVSGPYGYRTRTYVNRRWGDWEGMAQRVVVSQNSSVLQETVTSYEVGERVGSGSTVLPDGNKAVFERPRHIRKVAVKRDGEWYNTQFEYHTNQSSSNFSYGLPVEIKRWSTLGGGTRETEIIYHHDRNDNRLGLPHIVRQNGKEFDRYDYDSKGRVTSHKRFGVTVATYGYHGASGHQGALGWEKDGLNRITKYDNRKRGVPQKVTRPDGVIINRSVDSNGWVTAETDARGNTTRFKYDNSGRMRRITPPSPFAATTYDYRNLGSTTAHLIQEMKRGNERVDTHFTAFGNPALVWRAAVDGTISPVYQRTYYDLYGRPSRRIWPTENDARHGVDITYDALGRVTRERETVSPNATTSYAYLSDNRVRVTDPTGDITTTYSSGYGSPDDGQPTKIRQPHNTSTDMSYDIYGNLLTVRQFGTHNGVARNLTQRYSYDGRYRVCRHHIPEQGSSLFQYNNADEMIGVARGQSGTSGCATLPSSSKVVHTYNALGNIDLINFPDGSPDIDYRYDANENLYELYRGASRWSYRYHASADLPIEETLRIDGKTFQTLYAYNGNGHLARQTLKSSGPTRTIDFAPDAWGRATQAKQGSKSYSSGIQYHPNGAVRKLTYGNGQVYTQEMNNRWLPSRRDIRKGGTRANEWTYTYNADGRIDFIDDKIVGSNDRDHTYDGLGRLTRARIGSTNYDYKYDVTGNLLEKRIGSRVVSMEYHTNNRLRRVRDGSSSWRSYSYDSRGNVTNDGRRGFTYDRSEQPTRLTGGATGTYVYDGNYKRVKAVHAGTLGSGSTSTPSPRPRPTPPPNPCLANPFAPGCFEPPTCGNVFCDRSDEGTLSALAGSVIEDLGRSSGSGSETVYSAYGTGGQLLHQRKEGTGGTVETDYIVVAGMTVARIERFRSADTTTHPHTDHLGTTVSETNSAGTVLWRERATPFGERIGGQAAANNNQPSFTGHVEDARSQLTYMQGRFYDPVIGRMLAPDSVSFSGGGPAYFNRYSYTANDPINLIDPTGEIWGVIAAVGTAIIAGAIEYFDSNPHDNDNLLSVGVGTSGSVPLGIDRPSVATTSFTYSGGQLNVDNAYGVAPVVVAGVSLAARRIALNAAKGKAFEVSLRVALRDRFGDEGRIIVGGRVFKPDGLTATFLNEAKFVRRLSYSRQLRAFDQYSRQNGLIFNLYVSPRTRISGPLRRASSRPGFNIVPWPFPARPGIGSGIFD